MQVCRHGAVGHEHAQRGDGDRYVAVDHRRTAPSLLERILSIEIVRVTERAAVSAARLRGHGKDKASDQAAVDAMRRELNKLPIDGTVVIGEGELRRGADAVHRREGRHQDRPQGRYRGRSAGRHRRCAPRTCRARSRRWRWPTPARCCTRPTATWTRSRSGRAIRRARSISTRRPTRTSCTLAKAKGVKPSEITAILLDRPRHAEIDRSGAQDRRGGAA